MVPSKTLWKTPGMGSRKIRGRRIWFLRPALRANLRFRTLVYNKISHRQIRKILFLTMVE